MNFIFFLPSLQPHNLTWLLSGDSCTSRSPGCHVGCGRCLPHNPIKPDQKQYLVVHFEGLFYIDHVIPFGLTSTSGLQGEVADATVDIWEHHDITPAVKWVDNFSVFCFPKIKGLFHGISNSVMHTYGYDLTFIKSIIAPLGIPWHKNKGQEFSDTFSYLGFHWDLPNKTVSLPNLKCEKYICKLSSLFSACERAQVFKAHVESIIGTLLHITFVYQHRCSYMPNLYKWLTSFVNDYVPHWITPSALTDLQWWLVLLSKNHAPHSLNQSGPTCNYNIWVNASTDWGIRLIWSAYWVAWKLLDGWKGPSRNIGWLEGVAVELAIQAMRMMGVHNVDVLIRSDNEGVISAFSKG
jgi:hypothetical protein